MRGQAFHYEAPSEGLPARFTDQTSHTTRTLESVWGSSPTDVWAVGEGGVIQHFAGGTRGLDDVTSPTSQALHNVWGTGPKDIWAVGDRGTVVHHDGNAWSLADAGLPIGFTPNLFGVWGSGPDDVWIVGDGVILHRTMNNRRHP
jgi:hypothetical protein